MVDCGGNNTDPLVVVTRCGGGIPVSILPPASKMTVRHHIKLLLVFLAETRAPAEATQALCQLDNNAPGTVRGSIRLEGDARATQ